MQTILRVLALIMLWSAVNAAEVSVDFASAEGEMRPLQGVNLGPLCYRGTVDLSAYHRELGIPLTRLHDVVWLQADAVDVSTIFRDFRNDPEKPESYDFAATDDYVQAVINAGSKIVYRLGESIEHTPRKYRVHPPADPEKWARICAGIVRHYNEGWANGSRHGITYWEIWNEPDVRPAMWTGTDEEFFRLFEVTAKRLKKEFPNIKVGGPGLGGTGSFVGDRFVAAPFCTNFLARCRERRVPLDFVSWHRYASDPWVLPRLAKAMRSTLDGFGFTNAESHLNEWNYLPRDDWRPLLKEGQGALRQEWYEEMSGAAGAAFDACGLILLQSAPLDAANFYTGEIQGFGLFNIHGVPKKNFYAFKAFREMLDTPLRVKTSGGIPGQRAVLAGMRADTTRASVLISNFRAPAGALNLELRNLPWKKATHAEIFVVDRDHNLERVGIPAVAEGRLTLQIEMPSVVLVKLRGE